MSALTERDIDTAFQRLIPSWEIERLDTRMGTVDVAKRLRSAHGSAGGVGDVADGPYSDGSNVEWWSLEYDARGSRGVEVKVTHTVRADDVETVLRQGTLSWNLIANRATFSALKLRRDREPAVGEQIAMFA